MTNELVKQSADMITFDDEKVSLIKRTVAKGATDDELELFLHQCKRTGLDPLARQIYFQKYNTKNGPQIAIITGIDGYRLVAARTGLYAGNDEPVFDGKQTYNNVSVPAKATVTVWKIVSGVRCPFSASVYWDEYCPNPPKDYQWKKMPHVMLAKCGEAAALRKAFPADLGTVYTNEEMQQADFVTMQDIDNFNQDIYPDDDLDDAIVVDVDVVEDERGDMAPEAQNGRDPRKVNHKQFGFTVGDEVMVKGDNDEALGVVVGFTPKMVRVDVGGNQFNTKPERLEMVTS